MSVSKKNILLAVLSFISISIFGQYTMNSPYSRFGLGDLEQGGFAINKSMGGIGIALRETNQINYLNPASYTAQDSMSFVWDIGMKGNITTYNTSAGSMKQRNYNFDHLALSFPIINKKYYASAGMIPYSKKGYSYFEKDTFSDGETLLSKYNGSGNISRFYIGNGISLLNDKINLGFNISYLFGSLTNSTIISIVEDNSKGIQPYKVYDAGITGWLFTLGAQGIFPLSNDLSLTIGAVFEPKTNLDAEVKNQLLRYADTLADQPDTGKYVIPARFGGGMSFQYKNKLTFGLDYTMQDWSKASFLGTKDDNLSSSKRISCGLQYVHDKESYTNYFAKVRVRAGFYFEDTYLELRNKGIKDYGFTVGLGLPFRRTNTMFNVGLEMGKRGTTQNQLIEDSYMRISVSVSLFDYWFYKRKYD